MAGLGELPLKPVVGLPMYRSMEPKSTTVRQGAPEEPNLSAKGMEFLTGGLTSEGDTFLIAAGAVLLSALLYPLVGGWALLAFVLTPTAAVLVRGSIRRKGRTRRIAHFVRSATPASGRRV